MIQGKASGFYDMGGGFWLELLAGFRSEFESGLLISGLIGVFSRARKICVIER
jgi:hypothetical protein